MHRPAHENQGSKRISTLVHYCQRILNANIDAITGFGEDMPHRLVRPILQGCSADTLLRLERETPHIVEDNEEIWRDLCLRSYPADAEQYIQAARGHDDPQSCRDVYFLLREAEAKRLEKAGNRIRNQRLEAEELKKKRQVKLTDRVPPPKRSRHGWSSTPAPQKSLFQKTRAEATKIQKNVFGARMLPPMPSSKGYRTSLGLTSAQISLGGECATQVTVTTVVHRMPSVSSPSKSTDRVEPSRVKPSTPPRPKPAISHDSRSPPRPPITPKKDPMSALFMPKHRSHSQLPTSDSVPTR